MVHVFLLIGQYTIDLSQHCPYCRGEGVHSHTCPLCGGRGVINTPRGMTYCTRCGGHGVIAGSVCEHCHGSGVVTHQHVIQLRIPAGAPDGWSKVFKVGENQKVRIRMHQKPHSVFQRQGDNIVMHVQLSLKEVPKDNYVDIQALLGTTIQVPTLTSIPETVTFQSGSVQPFGEVRVKRKGLTHFSSWVKNILGLNRGDLVLITDVVFPDQLTESQRKGIIEAFDCYVCSNKNFNSETWCYSTQGLLKTILVQ